MGSHYAYSYLNTQKTNYGQQQNKIAPSRGQSYDPYTYNQLKMQQSSNGVQQYQNDISFYKQLKQSAITTPKIPGNSKQLTQQQQRQVDMETYKQLKQQGNNNSQLIKSQQFTQAQRELKPANQQNQWNYVQSNTSKKADNHLLSQSCTSQQPQRSLQYERDIEMYKYLKEKDRNDKYYIQQQQHPSSKQLFTPQKDVYTQKIGYQSPSFKETKKEIFYPQNQGIYYGNQYYQYQYQNQQPIQSHRNITSAHTQYSKPPKQTPKIQQNKTMQYYPYKLTPVWNY